MSSGLVLDLSLHLILNPFKLSEIRANKCCYIHPAISQCCFRKIFLENCYFKSLSNLHLTCNLSVNWDRLSIHDIINHIGSRLNLVRCQLHFLRAFSSTHCLDFLYLKIVLPGRHFSLIRHRIIHTRLVSLISKD